MPNAFPYQAPVVIANGASLSGAIPIDGALGAIEMPATWTAANLTFQGSHDNSTFNDIYDEAGTEYTVTAAASRYIIVDPTKFAGVRYVKVRSGTTGSAVNQGGARTINLVCYRG